MEVWRKQCLLALAGFLPYRDIDDIWGDQTQGATEAFQIKYQVEPVNGIFDDNTLKRILEVVYNQEGFAVDNFVGDKKEPTGTFWDRSEFFDREEFRCQCGGKYCDGFPAEPAEELVRVCNEIRRRLGVPVTIVESGGSGVRCSRHNAAVGGVGNSNHLYGLAADLHSRKSPQEMYRVAEEVLAGTGELGLYDWGIHVGVNCTYSRF